MSSILSGRLYATAGGAAKQPCRDWGIRIRNRAAENVRRGEREREREREGGRTRGRERNPDHVRRGHGGPTDTRPKLR